MRRGERGYQQNSFWSPTRPLRPFLALSNTYFFHAKGQKYGAQIEQGVLDVFFGNFHFSILLHPPIAWKKQFFGQFFFNFLVRSSYIIFNRSPRCVFSEKERWVNFLSSWHLSTGSKKYLCTVAHPREWLYRPLRMKKIENFVTITRISYPNH